MFKRCEYRQAMKRICVLTLVLSSGCSRGPQPSDAKLILGEWVVVDFHSRGGSEDRSQLRKKATVTEGTWSQSFQGDRFEDFEYSLDPGKSPKEIDFIYTAPDAKRMVVRGIYILSGDRLTLCVGSAPLQNANGKVEVVESRRPRAFDVNEGLLISYRRRSD